MFKNYSSIYFPWSTTYLRDLYLCNKELKDSKLSAAVINQINDGDATRDNPFDDAIELPPMLPEQNKQEQMIEWVRIRIEPQKKIKHHCCIGFTPEELEPYQDPTKKRKATSNSTTTNDTGDTSKQKKNKLLKTGLSEEKTNHEIVMTKEIRLFLHTVTIGMARDQEVTIIDNKEFKLTVTRRS